MKRLLGTCLVFAGLVGLMGTAMAELSIHQSRLSVNLQAAPLKDVLKELAHQGSIDLTLLETEKIKHATVSEQFHDVSVEEGLQLLLAEWNYGLTKHRGTGRIQEIFIASKRIDPGSTPAVSQPLASSRYPDPSRGSVPYDDSLIASFQEDESDDERSFEDSTDFDHDTSLTELTEDMLPEDLPPEIREELLRDLAANKELQ